MGSGGVVACWSPPPEGVVKFNTDGCWKDRLKAAVGGVSRGHLGNWIARFSARFTTRKPIEAELRAVREGERGSTVG